MSERYANDCDSEFPANAPTAGRNPDREEGFDRQCFVCHAGLDPASSGVVAFFLL
jgi:hypothetical protein